MLTTHWRALVLLGYSNEEVSRLETTAARLKSKGIDGDLYMQWSMWFNSKLREKPYHLLHISERPPVGGATCYRCCMAVGSLWFEPHP